MLQSRSKNFVYFLNQENDNKTSNTEVSNNMLQKILQTMAKQALKEKTPNVQELDHILGEVVQQSHEKSEIQQNQEEKETDIQGTGEPITKYLQKIGYLKDKKKWLTNKAFFEIGGKLLNDVMKSMGEGGFGFHETKNVGAGSVIMDTAKKLELGDDIRNLNVPQTILNSIQRIKKSSEIKFPIFLNIDDFEEFETIEETKVAVVYCIDLSSTMKYSVSSGEGSRIEAAKKALWALYVLNKKFFPNDSVYVVGFGSLASEVDPYDIPYLKTYDSNDNFLHYTNYQAAFRLALKILKRDGSQNKRIVMITDGQPSASFIDNESQKMEILSDKPYSHFYKPDEATLLKLQNERDIKLDISGEMVYLCYRYRQVDPVIDAKTLFEAKKCKREGIEIDTIMVSEEVELLSYVEGLERQLKGRAYYINPENIDKILITDFISNKKKILNSKQAW
ncbi:von Willebrand factor type A domain protein [uncultured archaeon]|nr:von Willebrand factor type A domain protein [uncultured archaeon]